LVEAAAVMKIASTEGVDFVDEEIELFLHPDHFHRPPHRLSTLHESFSMGDASAPRLD